MLVRKFTAIRRKMEINKTPERTGEQGPHGGDASRARGVVKRQLGQELLLHHDVPQREGGARGATAAAAAAAAAAKRQPDLLLVFGASR